MSRGGRTEAELRDLRAVADQALSTSVVAALRTGLTSRSHLVVARAADLASRKEARDLVPDLACAFARFVDGGAKSDPGCAAKLAVVRALAALETGDAAVFLAGVRHVQSEPVWGGEVDTAGMLRGVALQGLVAMGHREALYLAVPLLVDRVLEARRLAVEALGHAGGEGAELLLRLKALAGDAEPIVVGDCLAALIGIHGPRSLSFVVSFLDAADGDVATLAGLALGSSRLPEALRHLRDAFAAFPDERRRERLILPIALVRSDEATAFLLDVVRSETTRLAVAAVKALRETQRDEAMCERLARVAREREDPQVTAALAVRAAATPD